MKGVRPAVVRLHSTHSEMSMLHSFLRCMGPALALCALLAACSNGSSDAATDTGGAGVTVQGVATPKDVAVVTAKNAQ